MILPLATLVAFWDCSPVELMTYCPFLLFASAYLLNVPMIYGRYENCLPASDSVGTSFFGSLCCDWYLRDTSSWLLIELLIDLLLTLIGTIT